MLAYACAHPPGESDGYDGAYLRRDEIERMDLRGVPVCLEHDPRTRVGRVVSSWAGADGSMRCILETSDETTAGRFAGQVLSRGVAGEVSLGTECTIDPSRWSVTGKRVREISLVHRGARPGTRVHAVAAAPAATGGGADKSPAPRGARPAPSDAAMTDAQQPAAPIAADAPAPAAAPAPADAQELVRHIAALEKEREAMSKEREAIAERLADQFAEEAKREIARVQKEAEERIAREREELARQREAAAEEARREKGKALEMMKAFQASIDVDRMFEQMKKVRGSEVPEDVRTACRSFVQNAINVDPAMLKFVACASEMADVCVNRVEEAIKSAREAQERLGDTDAAMKLFRARLNPAAPGDARFVSVGAVASAGPVAAPPAPAAAAAAPVDNLAERIWKRAREGKGMDVVTMIGKRFRAAADS